MLIYNVLYHFLPLPERLNQRPHCIWVLLSYYWLTITLLPA